MTENERIDWLVTAENFYHSGNLAAMQNAAKEILADPQFAADGEALAVAAEAALLSGDEAAAENYLAKAAAPSPRSEFVRALGDIKNLRFTAAAARLQKILRLEAVAAPATPYDRATRERADRHLADCLYLFGNAKAAARCLFDAAEIVKNAADAALNSGSNDAAKQFPKLNSRAAALFSQALFLTAYNPPSPNETLHFYGRYGGFFSHIEPLSLKARSLKSGRALRIGLISRDFRQHAMMPFIVPFLKYFNRRNTIVYAYQMNEGDAATAKLRKLGAAFRDVCALSPAETAAAIASDLVDVLFDLSGHSQGNALPVLAYRPAPVIVSALGFLHTSGLPAVDYHLADRVTAPENQLPQAARLYSEKLLHNGGAPLFCFSPADKNKYPPVNALPASDVKKPFTYGCLNNYAKINDRVLLLWRAVLERVPYSRLVLQNKLASLPDGEGEKMILRRLSGIGIDPARVKILPFSPDYLKTYHHIDAALDPFPYNGGLTTCEALYMGVPVVTLYGDRPAARVGASILTAAGLPEFVAPDEKSYVNIASRLPREIRSLAARRAAMRENLLKSPLMDGESYMAAIEKTARSLV